MIKGLWVIVGVAFAGVVGYKLLEKQNPALLKKIKGSVSEAGDKVAAVVADAKESFYEGYAQG